MALSRFYLDEDLPAEVAVAARSLGLDVSSARELGRFGLSDTEQLHFAAAEQRCLVTRNRDDFIQLTDRFFQRGWVHAGVLIVSRSLPNTQPARIAQALVRYTERHNWVMPSYTLDFFAAEHG